MGSTSAVTMPRAPAWPLLLLFWLNPLWALLAGLDPQRPALPLVPVSVALGFGAVALVVLAAAAALALRPGAPARWRAAFAAGGLTTILSGACGFDPLTGVGFGVAVLGVGLGGLALARADAPTTRRCVGALLWSSLCAGALALIMLVTQRPSSLYEYDNARAVGTFLNPNELGAYAVASLGAALPIAVATRDRLAIAASCVLGATLLATFSRWGLVSAVCAGAAFAASVRSRGTALAVVAVAAVALASDVAFGAQHHNPVDTLVRAPAWSAGLATFEHFPLLGVGPLAYARTYDALRPPDAPGPGHPIAYDPHSMPIAQAASGGIIGLVALIATAGWLLRIGYRAAAQTSDSSRYLVLGLLAGIVGVYVDAIPNTLILLIPLMYQSAGLALAVARNARA